MDKQRWLDFVQQELLEALWERFPEEARGEATRHYARLMARMLAGRVHFARHGHTQEESDDPRDR